MFFAAVCLLIECIPSANIMINNRFHNTFMGMNPHFISGRILRGKAVVGEITFFRICSFIGLIINSTVGVNSNLGDSEGGCSISDLISDFET